MSLPSVSGVISMLKNEGFRAYRGYPGTIAPEGNDPVVAVRLHQYDVTDSLLTVCAEVRSPASSGGGLCEETAVTVAHALAMRNARCRLNPCAFDGRTGQFYVQVEATWSDNADSDAASQGLPYYIQRNGVLLPYVIGFTAQRQVDTETVGAIGEEEAKTVLCRDGGWELTVEELFPRGQLGKEPEGALASLDLVRDNGVEYYRNCRVVSLQRKDTMDGVKQTTVCHCVEREVQDFG